jgi:hypothetical protein
LREIHHPAPTREPIDLEEYGGKWIAIRNRRIIDSDRDLDALCDRLEAVGLEERAILMKVPRPGIVAI